MRLIAYTESPEAVRPILAVIVRDELEARQVARRVRDTPGPRIAFFELVKDGRVQLLTA